MKTKEPKCVFCGKPEWIGYVDICQSCWEAKFRTLARRLLKRVNKMAEADMLKTHQIAGAHSRSIEKLLKELK